LYKVQVEKFPDKKQAVRFANRLQSREHLNNFVTAYQPG